MSRSAWTDLTDDQLLAQCAVDTYRASGPGGQKRNKTSSAVRLRHHPTGLLVIAEESRSQHENKARALRRLRRQGIQLLLTLSEEPLRRDWVNDAGLLVLHVPVEDMEAPTQAQLDHCVSAIRRARAQGLGVAVHCAAGLGRTGSVLAAYFV